MKPAETLIDFYKNMTPSRYLTPEQREFYVSIYDHKIKELRLDLIELGASDQTIYVSGQSGSGKTTALNFLPNKAIESEYLILSLKGSEVFNLDDIQIVDVLLLLSRELVNGEPQLEKLFQTKLERITKRLQGKFEEMRQQQEEEATNKGMGISGWIKGNPVAALLNFVGVEASAYADYKLNNEKRTIVREVFAPNITDILNLTNDIILEYLSVKDPSGNKRLLVIFHEFNHIRNLEAIRTLFIKNRQYLEGIKARKVVTIPVSLVPDPEFEAEIRFLGLKVKPSRLDPNPESQAEAKANRAALKEIIHRRIAEGVDILTDEALEYAIEQSGGNIRQLLSILYFAARRVAVLEGKKVSLEDAKAGATEMRHILERSIITGDKIRMLNYIGEHSVAGGTERLDLFLQCALSNQVFIYKNNKTWYGLNPLIEETVRLYAKKLEDSENEEKQK